MSSIQTPIQNVYILNVLIQTPILNHSHSKCSHSKSPFKMTMVTMTTMTINKQADRQGCHSTGLNESHNKYHFRLGPMARNSRSVNKCYFQSTTVHVRSNNFVFVDVVKELL